MRAVVIFLVGMLLGACARPQTVIAQPDPYAAARSAEDLAQKTVALVEVDGDDVRPFCTGVWVSQTSILTANHCVDDVMDAQPVRFAMRDGLLDANGAAVPEFVTHSSVVYARDEAHDLALLRALDPPREHAAVTLDEKPIVVGEHVQVMGHPLGLLYSYSEGEVSAVRRLDLDGLYEDGSSWIQATVPISPGNSGGGLFDSDERLIGIVTATLRRGQNLNIFVHRSHIAAFLKKQTERTLL